MKTFEATNNTAATTNTENKTRKTVKETKTMNAEIIDRLAETNKRISELMAKLGLEIRPEEKVEAPAEKILPPEWVSCKYSDLLDEIAYYPNGDAPKDGNIFARPDEDETFWYCSNKPVGFYSLDGKIVKIANNAYERYCTTIANKWAMQRDWIPEYRYKADGTNEENEAYVGLHLQECLFNGMDKSEITKSCFDFLDFVYRAKPDTHKTALREENCNDAERFMVATLFTGDVNSLNRLTSDVDGHEIDLPTEDALVEFDDSDLKKFEAMKRLFARVHEAHELASEKCWLSAQCYALKMDTKDAVNFIWGDEANGLKKYRRCEVKYSRMCKQVYGWLLDEIEQMIMADDEELKWLEKWVKVYEATITADLEKLLATEAVAVGADGADADNA